ncbi:uncharacterized protein BXZ73DRAFT_108221 [Epithele typhae]|uniref:uncharacterized protein n=1 Tax=Epithele typhae TaxID=378194 RepID=UPI0020073CFF|nr:uncharacterized protein BXZ73DRAFT_108221 [Epithele typhae]KAH9911145.1 hypothetical protein BXZ73DRAFT_108221 [Epithele typhae]
METRLLPIRAMYVINSAEPYLLALSSTKASVSIIPPHLVPLAADDHITYGKVSLRPCLEAICQSSPELVPNGVRDYSVYAIDPFESRRKGAPSHSPGVAVGFGWMSDALRSPHPPTVFGTVSSGGIYDDALEVIFSIREGNRLPLPPVYPVPDKRAPKRGASTGALFTNNPLQRHRSPYPPPPHPPSAPLPVSHTYQPEPVAPPAAAPAPEPVPPADTGTQAALSALVLALANPQHTQQIMSALSSIDSSAAASPNPELVHLLGAMLASAAAAVPPPPSTAPAPQPSSVQLSALQHPASQPLAPQTLASPLPATQPPPPPVPAHATSISSLPLFSVPPPPASSLVPPTQDVPPSTPPTTDHAQDEPDVVVLDKENVNPTAFQRKPSEKGKGKEPARSPPRAAPLRHHNTAPVLYAPAQPVVPPLRPRASSSSLRKRTLSEIMDDRDRENDVSRKRPTGRRTVITAAELFQMPGFRRSTKLTPAASTSTANVASDPGWEHMPPSAPPMPPVPASSPPRPRRKAFVLPNWAHTNTTFLPRTGDGKYVSSDLSTTETQTRKKSGQKRAREKDKSVPKPRKRVATYKDPSENIAERSFHGPVALTPPPAGPTSAHPTAGPPRPVIASSPSVFGVPFAPSSSHNVLARSQAVEPPSTPPRRSRGSNPTTPEDDGLGSLFTPDHPSLRMSARTPRRLYNTTPASPLSPSRPPRTCVPSRPRHPSSSRSAGSVPDAPPLSTSVGTRTDPPSDDDDDDDMDVPMDSIPIASSDNEFDGASPSPHRRATSLARSSPLPPSSPILTPSDADWDSAQETDYELPPGDEIEVESTMRLDGLPAPGPPRASSNSDDEFLLLFSQGSDLFADGAPAVSASTDGQELLDPVAYSEFLAAFTQTLPAASQPAGEGERRGRGVLFDMAMGPFGNMLDADFQSAMFANPELYDAGSGVGLGDAEADLSEFWEMLRPVVGNSVYAIDPLKVAEGVQALLSGCAL